MAEAIKSAIGVGSKRQEGQEPVNGALGDGVLEPYDKGNKEGKCDAELVDFGEGTRHSAQTRSDDGNLGGTAPQNTDPAKAKAADSATPSGKSEAPPPDAPAVAVAAETSHKEPTAALGNGTHAADKPAIGSSAWFRTALPGSGKQTDNRSAEATAGADAATGVGNVVDEPPVDSAPVVNGSSPDHLGREVPSGHATVPDGVNNSTNANTVALTAPAATTSPSSHPAAKPGKKDSAEHVGIIGGVTGAAAGVFTKLNPFAASTGDDATMTRTREVVGAETATSPTTHSQQKAVESTALSSVVHPAVHDPPEDTASQAPSMTAEEKRNGKMPERSGSDVTQPQHGRRKSLIPPTSVNEGRIPVAGGIPLGQGEMVARRKSTYVAALPSVPGIPEAETAKANAAARVGGAGKEKAEGGKTGAVGRKPSVLGRMRSKLGRKSTG